METFKDIYIDITNTCNAKCPFCYTGKNKPENRKFIEPNIFNDILQALSNNKAINDNTIIYLYNWGEPFLHPALPELADILAKKKLKFGLSTNASVEYDLDDNFFKNLAFLRFSLSGFSQKSYDNIHGFKFDRIIKNVELLIKRVRSANPKTYIEINFHIYQFNLDELYACNDFANKCKVHFTPYLAILNDWDQLVQYIEHTLPYKELLEVAQNLLTYNIPGIMLQSPSAYQCPQYKMLVIDEVGNVDGCCQLPKNNQEYICGNILKDDWEKILMKKVAMPVCSDCLKSGLAYYLNNYTATPGFAKLPVVDNISAVRLLKIITNRLTRKVL
jgi:MoaA/NifB/PqqE/SkfB family radical SAM enzyme